MIALLLLLSTAQAATFDETLAKHPASIWAPAASEDLRESLKAFQQKRALPNGIRYGTIIRELDISALGCVDVIQNWAKAHQCTRQDSFILEGGTGKPVLDSQGKPYPLISFLCPDGGVVRAKPVADPTNPHGHEPTAIKAMRFFGKDRYDSYADEAFKVDRRGHAVPKGPADLDTHALNAAERRAYIDDWARDAHVVLGPCVKP